MQGGRTTLAAVLVAGLLLALAVPLAGAAVVATPGPLQRYREAHVALAGGEYARARTLLDELPPGFLLADYAAYFAAEALLREGDEALALARFRAFIERFPDSLLAAAGAARRPRHGLPAGALGRRRARGPAVPGACAGPPGGGPHPGPAGRGARGAGPGRRGHRRPPAPLDRGARVGRGARRRARAWTTWRARAGLPVAPLTVEEQFLQAQRLADAGEQSASVRAARGAPGPGTGADRPPPGAGPARADARAVSPGATRPSRGSRPRWPSRRRRSTRAHHLRAGAAPPAERADRARGPRVRAPPRRAPRGQQRVRRHCSSSRGRAPSSGQFNAAREAFQGVITRYPDSHGGRVRALGGRLARVPRGALPGVGARLPSALDDGWQRPARGTLLGGPLPRPARGEEPPRSPSTARC